MNIRNRPLAGGPRPEDANRPLYLDHNATTPVLPEAVEAMLPYLGERFGNPSSSHFYGREARAAVEGARENVARRWTPDLGQAGGDL